MEAARKSTCTLHGLERESSVSNAKTKADINTD